MEIHTSRNTDQNKAGVIVTDFRTRDIVRDQEEYFIIIKGQLIKKIQQP